jgi:hypothetical protein
VWGSTLKCLNLYNMSLDPGFLPALTTNLTGLEKLQLVDIEHDDQFPLKSRLALMSLLFPRPLTIGLGRKLNPE